MTATATPPSSSPTAPCIADVALLLEGTFPYVSGGVSSWVNQIIRAFPDLKFALIFLGSRREDYKEHKYELPKNVVHYEEHFLHDVAKHFQPGPRRGDPAIFEQLESLHSFFYNAPDTDRPGPPTGVAARLAMPAASMASIASTPSKASDAACAFAKLACEMGPGGKFPQEDLLYSEQAWEKICERYRSRCTDPSFVDYFWTVRIMHAPLWVLSDIAHRLPPVKIFHSVSTGYAGLLGAMLHGLRGQPLILSEHGIYTKERKIDLFKSEWIRDNRNIFQRDPTEVSYFRQLWVRFFESVGKLCYEAADPIIALYETNRLRQVTDGADPARTLNIPNGVSLTRFGPLRALRPDNAPDALPPPVLCLIGRVVPIKDIKTFIRAMRRVVNELPGAEGWIAGPTDEDPAYATECRNLIESLGLGDHVKLLGYCNVADLMPKIGLSILSSISEALPLVILEGYAAGVPTISTDVGSCRQLVEGLDAEDRALGASGRIVGIADPQALADASLELLTSAPAWHAASTAGIARVERYYSDRLMFDRYRKVYDEALNRPLKQAIN